MTKYFIDENGKYLGAFDGVEPPADAVEVPSPPESADDVYVNGEWDNLSRIKKQQRNLINSSFQQAIQQITAAVPTDEISSWDKQETEARAWTADNSAVTPLIDAIALSRGMDKAVLVGKIIAKADAFAAIVGDLIGKRQALEDQIDALPEAATESDITSITWS